MIYIQNRLKVRGIYTQTKQVAVQKLDGGAFGGYTWYA